MADEYLKKIEQILALRVYKEAARYINFRPSSSVKP